MGDSEDKIKQVIIIRRDLKMKGGKLAAQACHAAMKDMYDKWLSGKKPTDIERTWGEEQFTKVCLEVNSEEELQEIFQKAKVAGLAATLITDAGHTVFKEPTMTCVGIGPDWGSKIGRITGHLKLYGGH